MPAKKVRLFINQMFRNQAEMDLTLPFDEVHINEITKDHFHNNYLKKNKPVVIKGLLEQTPAGKLWTLDRMFERLGDYPIEVFDNNKKNGTSYIFANQTVPMRTMLNLVKQNESSNLRMFVNPILKKDKALAAELPCPDFFKGPLQLPNLLFLGGKDCIVPLHYDFMKDEGLLTQFYGKKEIIMVDPSQAALLYRLPLNTTSFVNLFEPDYEQYPALKKVRGYKITLNHGDTVYIPSGYWHQLKYVDASMSVAFRRWHSKPLVTVQTALLRSLQIPFDKSVQAIFGNTWLNYKKKVAQRKAAKVAHS